MGSAKKRIQVRRCQACQRVGHNQATCKYPPAVFPAITETPKRSASTQLNAESFENVVTDTVPTTKPATQPLKFFVHHVSYEPNQSPHVLNLKKDNSMWDNVKSAAPEKNSTLYHTYHEVEPVTPSNQQLKVSISPIIPEPPKITWREKINERLTRLKAPKGDALFSVTLDTSNQPNYLPTQVPAPVFLENDSFGERLQTIGKAIFSKQRLALASVLLMSMVIIPGPALSYYQNLVVAKDSVIKDSTEAFLALQDSTIALKQANLAAAEEATNDAYNKFQNVITQLDDKRFLRTIAGMIPMVGGSLESREKIIVAGQEITIGNGHLLEGIKKSQDPSLTTLTDRMKTILAEVHNSLPYYAHADQLFSEVDNNSLPLEYQAQFSDYKKLFSSIVKDFKTIDELGATLLNIFGAEGQRRYILVFQNPHELRASGGFAGSFAVMDIKDGAMVKLDIPPGGTYDVSGYLKKFVEPPTPLLIANKRWEFQDSNWFPDFPTTAKKVLWFYRNSYSVTADGVIAINSTVLERLLRIIGPVTDTKRGLTLDSESAIQTLQKVVEEGPEKKINKPKQILTDNAPELLKSLGAMKPENILPLLSTMQEALSQKEIQAYFIDEQSQQTITDFGWSGRMLPTSEKQDFVMVVNSNIQGQKSDAKIEQNISHQAVVSQDGTVIATVVVTRQHTGDKGEKLYGQTNIDYLRLYVPENSELLSASGFTWPDEKAFRAPEKWYTKDEMLGEVEKNERIDAKSGTRITDEFGKTTFGNWIITEPGETTQVQFTYRLPFKMTPETKTGRLEKVINALTKELAEYQLLVGRQSGSKTTFESQIIFPDSWQTSWQNGEGMTLASNGARIAPRPLTKDTVWSLLMER